MQDLFKAGLINNIQLWYGTHHVSSKYCFYSETLIILKFSLIMIKKKKKEKKDPESVVQKRLQFLTLI